MGLDTKVVLDEMNQTWALMKGAMDEAMAEAKKAGAHSGELETQIQRMDGRLDELETSLKRLPRGSAVDPESPEGQLAAEKKRIYFEILRHDGFEALSPEDRQKAKDFKMFKQLLTKEERLAQAESKALAVGDDTTGGFLAPPEYVLDIIKGVQLISPIRGMATVRTTNRRSVQYPVRSGVFAAQWTGETSLRSETAGLSYSMEEIPVYEMYALVIVSEDDLDDTAFDLAGEIADNASEQFAKAEGAAFVVGDGLKKPEGYMNATGIATDLSGTAGTIATAISSGVGSGDGLIKCAFNLKTAYASGASWTLNRKSVGAVRRLMDSQSRYLWEPAFSVGTGSVSAGATILGIPYVEVPDMQDEGASNFPIALGNFKRGCILVDRLDMTIRRLNELFAQQGQVAFLVRKRVGFQVVLPEAIRKYKSNNS